MNTLMLYPHQKTLLSSLRKGFNEGHKAQMLYGPCGAGKTEIAAAMMKAVSGRGLRATMIVDLTLLCHQTSARLQKYGIDHGVIMPESPRWRPEQNIQIAMIQTIEARQSWPATDLLIIDEAHSTRKSVVEFIRARPNMEVVGLSGSPFTKGLGAIYSNIVSGITVNELVAEEKLIYPKIFIATPIDMTGAKKIAGEWTDKEVTERGAKIAGDIVAEWQSKSHDIFGKPAKTIVFCAGIAHGADLADKFSNAGFNFITLSHKSEPTFRAEVIEEFAKTDSSVHGLIATDLLTKGFDVADVSIMISARPFSKSFSSHVQQMGRIMRTHLLKESACLLDHAGNYLRFRDQWDLLCSDGVTELDDGSEKTKPEPTDKEKERAKCPKCSALWPSNSDICTHCGFVIERKSRVVEVAGEMLELTPAKSKTKEFTADQKQEWYSQFLYLENTWRVKKYWSFAMFINKFGHKPAGYKSIAKPASQEVINYAKSRFMANKFARKSA